MQYLPEPEIPKLRSETELAKLDTEKALEFLTEEHKLAYAHKTAHVAHAIHCGRILNLHQQDMEHGKFRAWAKRGGLNDWQITYYKRIAMAADRFGGNAVKMSARALLRIEKKPSEDKEARRKSREKNDKRAPATKRREQFTLLGDEVLTALHDDRTMFGEVLVPILKQALKEYGKTAERQKAVRAA